MAYEAVDAAINPFEAAKRKQQRVDSDVPQSDCPAESSEESKEGDIIDESEENESFVQRNASFEVIASETKNIVT